MRGLPGKPCPRATPLPECQFECVVPLLRGRKPLAACAAASQEGSEDRSRVELAAEARQRAADAQNDALLKVNLGIMITCDELGFLG